MQSRAVILVGQQIVGTSRKKQLKEFRLTVVCGVEERSSLFAFSGMICVQDRLFPTAVRIVSDILEEGLKQTGISMPEDEVEGRKLRIDVFWFGG